MVRVILAVGVLVASCGGGETTIAEIQGTGARSPLEGRRVVTSGIVTAARADGRGFWIQQPVGDGDPESSDALLVWTELSATPGDRVRVRGTVAEFAADGGLSLTQIQDVEELVVLSTMNALPAAVALSPLPGESIPDAIRYWSRRESMLVSFERARVVGPTNRFGEMVVVLAAQAPAERHLFVRPLVGGAVDYNPERILIDDETRDATEARPGDEIRDLTGVVDYSFGNFKLQPIELEHVAGSRVTTRPRTVGGVSVASFNLENLFDDDRDALETKLERLTGFIERALVLPEILVVQEVESEAVLQRLGDRLNLSAAAGTRYRAKSLGSSDGRGIENGFLYDTARVALTRSWLLAGPDIDAAFGSESPSPGREPLVGVFDVGGAELWVVGNHFKSKRGDDPLFGLRQPFQRPTEVQRKAQAHAVRGFAESLLEEDPRAFVLIAGDFNDFAFAEAGEGPDHPLAILEDNGTFTNLVAELASPYTFIFDGNAQAIDHLLVSPALRERVLGTEIVHGNADGAGRGSDHDPPLTRLRLP